MRRIGDRHGRGVKRRRPRARPFAARLRCLHLARHPVWKIIPCFVQTDPLPVQATSGNWTFTMPDQVTLPIRPNMQTNARWQFVLVYTAPAAAKAEATEDVTAAVLDGAVRVGDDAGLPLHHFPLDRTAEAHAAVERGAVGKVLIDVID